MKKKYMLSIAFAFSLLFSATMSATNNTFTGSISDDMCGFKHMMKGVSAKDCVEACVKHGSKYVLADSVNHKLYAIDNPAQVKPYAGQSVVITGSLAKDGKTIHVASVKAYAGKSK